MQAILAIAVYCVKQTVESVLESLVSKYENHFPYNRNLDEESINEEFEIAANGPCLAYCSNALWHNFNGARTLLFFSSISSLTEFNSCYKVLNMTGKQGGQVEQFAPSILDSPSLPHLTFC